MEYLQSIHPNELLRVETGSSLYDLDTEQSDIDLTGIMIEPKEDIFGLEKAENIRQRSVDEHQQSGPGSIDLTIHTLKHWISIAIKGNPNFIPLLYAPEEKFHYLSPHGQSLLELRGEIISKRHIQTHISMLNLFLVTTRDRIRDGLTIPDNKTLRRVLLTAIQGSQLAAEGHVSIPMRREDLGICRAIRDEEIRLRGHLKICRWPPQAYANIQKQRQAGPA